MYAYGSEHAGDQTSMGFLWSVFFDEFGGDIGERAGERLELVVRRVEDFFSVQR